MKATALIFLLFICQAAFGRYNFVTNPDLPYPPGCAGDPGRTPVPFLEGGTIPLRNLLNGRTLELRLDAFRVTCSEPGRSLVWLRLSAHGYADRKFAVEVPIVQALLSSGEPRLMSLVTSPNGWGEHRDPHLSRRLLAHHDDPDYGPHHTTLEWTFLLDNAVSLTSPMTAEEYNGRFNLRLFEPEDNTLLEFAVPATTELLEPEPGIPFSGRLSGLWVIQGAADQGFTLSISNRVAPAGNDSAPRESLPLVLFLAQYTYDREGRLLWLTGAADFEQGGNQVSLEMVRVMGGEFMGDTRAAREIIGSVRLVANSCNDLTLEYDYSAIGLGSGSHRLQRLFALETAGHDCRDYAAKAAQYR